jgi:ribose-phosphate pyrophosphokinase
MFTSRAEYRILLRGENAPIYLVIPYLPYSRQDRVCSYGDAHSLKVFSTLINSANFDSVITVDAHSDVSLGLINNMINAPIDLIVESVVEELRQTYDSLYIVSPDSGANKKINQIYSYLNYLVNTFESTTFELNGLVKCDKYRDTSTGAIAGTEVFANDLQNKQDVLQDEFGYKPASII